MNTSNCSDDNSGRTTKSNNYPTHCTRNSDIQLSKSLSWVLRHAAPSVGLQLAPDGYVPLAEILALHHPRFRTKDNRPKYTAEDVIRVVENNDKQRFRLEFRDVDGGGGEESRDKRLLCIRANQGHSLKGLRADQLLTPLTTEQLSNPSLFIIHGTTQKAWKDHIQYEGLSRRERNHIHFATGLPTSTSQPNANDNTRSNPPISGMRSSSEIYIYINGTKCAADGIPFYRSDNGVILTAGVNDMGMLPTKYFEKVIEATTGTILWENEEYE